MEYSRGALGMDYRKALLEFNRIGQISLSRSKSRFLDTKKAGGCCNIHPPADIHIFRTRLLLI